MALSVSEAGTVLPAGGAPLTRRDVLASAAVGMTTSTLARQVSTWITRLLPTGGRNDSLSPGALVGSAKEWRLARQQRGSRHRLQRPHRQPAGDCGAVPRLGADLQVPAEGGQPVRHPLQPSAVPGGPGIEAGPVVGDRELKGTSKPGRAGQADGRPGSRSTRRSPRARQAGYGRCPRCRR